MENSKPKTPSPLSNVENVESLSNENKQLNLNDLFKHVQVLINGVQLAQDKGGVYSFKDSSVINSAIESIIDFTNKVNKLPSKK